jgi:hypothetical protein
MDSVSVVYNTFDSNGAGSTSSSRSEINLDASGSGAGSAIGRNIFNAGNRLINNCYDSAGRGFRIDDNVLNGLGAPSGAGNCVGTVIQANPQFVDAANGDYHTQNPVVASYGAYGQATALSAQDTTFTEGNMGATAVIAVRVTLSPAASSTVTVSYATANGTAAAGSDYTAASGSLTFAAGETFKTIAIPIVGDTVDEPNETFVVNLSNPTNASLADGQATVTIVDDDPTPSPITVTEAEIGNTLATYSLTGDFDRDGNPDLLWHHQGRGSLYVWFLADGKRVRGSYLRPARVLNRDWEVRGLADLDGDSHTDLVWQDKKSGALAAWLMKGTRRVSAISIPSIGWPAPSWLPQGPQPREVWQARGLADIDGDGHPDVIWHHPRSGDVYVWLMNGLAPTMGVAVNPGPFADADKLLRGLADFNGDDHVDLLWQRRDTGDLYVWFMNGTTAVGGAYTRPARPEGTRWQLVRVMDLNGDGKPDLLWQDRMNGDLRAWYMNGRTAVSAGSIDPVRPSDPEWKLAPQ